MQSIKCPTCQRVGDWLAGKFGPFCSHRCKLIDLGKWLDGKNGISEPLDPEQIEDLGVLLPEQREEV